MKQAIMPLNQEPQYRRTHMSKKKIMLGVAVGAAVGSALGMLMAPAKGKATRKQLLQKSADITNSAKRTIDKYSDVVKDEYDAMRKGTPAVIKKGKKKVAALRSK
jgi:gas vesicle protein